MHEMSLAEGVVQIIEDAAREQGFSKVKTVFLEIGWLSSVEPDAMAGLEQVGGRRHLDRDATDLARLHHGG